MTPAAWEWHSFDGQLPGTPRAGSAPLHVGPGRWLLVAAQEAWIAELQAAQQDGRGALVDVSGRWVPFEFVDGGHDEGDPADSATHPLAAAAPLDLLLKDRDVAALWMFDCPVLLVRRNGATGVLVEASYAHSFRAMLATL